MDNLKGYKIIEELHKGENSVVYLAFSESLNKNVVLKTQGSASGKGRYSRIKREYNILKEIEDENIIKTYGIEKYETGRAIVLEYFSGFSIREHLKKGKMNIYDFLNFAIALIETVGNIHRQNIIHKDLSPTNILWNDETSTLKIIDFGISAVIPLEIKEFSPPEKLEGTLLYMAPEQTGRMNRPVDYRSDYYSVGLVLYEMITGKKAYENNVLLDIVYEHLAKYPTAPNHLDNDIPEAVSEIIMKLIHKDSHRRYQSSYGILHDLKKCLTMYENNKYIENFEVGIHDIPEKYRISNKIYGRDVEVKILEEAFNDVCEFQINKVVLISGSSGIGKTSLVKELFKIISERKGYFIEGKFEQLKQNTPYLAITEALNKLIRQILAEERSSFSKWQSKILKEVGSLGQLLINLVPKLEEIIGPQPDVPTLSPENEINRFNSLMENFFKVLASKERPVVLFMDDLQWADQASLRLIKEIIASRDISNFFVIGAYRDNESNYLINNFVDSLHQKKVSIDNIKIKPLRIRDMSSWISESFYSYSEGSFNLAEYCLEKTKGNPFFIVQLLKKLYEDRLIYFEKNQGVWKWNIDDIKKANITDNVILLMSTKLKKIEKETMEFLKFGACFGNKFDSRKLAIVSGESIGHVEALMIKALKEGIIFVHESDENTYLEYKFVHDKIQKAAYALIEEEKRAQIHLDIGRLLIKEFDTIKVEENIFEIVDHFNIAKKLILSNDEKILLRKLNYKAGVRAKNTLALDIAYKYLEASVLLVDNELWEKDSEKAIKIHVDTGKVALLLNKFDVVDKLFNECEDRINKKIKIVDMYKIKAANYAYQGLHEKAVDFIINAISKLDIKIEKKITTLGLLYKNLQVNYLLTRENIVNLKEIKDDNYIAMFDLIYESIDSLKYIPQNLYDTIILDGLRASLKKGKCKNSHIQLISYSIMLLLRGMHKKADKYFEKSNLLFETLEGNYKKGAFIALYSNYHDYKHRSFKSLSIKLKNAYKQAIEEGDLESATQISGLSQLFGFFAGINLKVIIGKVIRSFNNEEKFKKETHLKIDGLLLDMLNILTNKSECDDFIKNNIYEVGSTESENQIVFFESFIKAILSYLYDYKKETVNWLNKAWSDVTLVKGTVIEPLLEFYGGLILIKAYESEQRKEYLSRINKCRKELKVFLRDAPINFAHKYYLLEAEYHRLKGKYDKALSYYERSIKLGKEKEQLFDVAIASECLAKYYLEIDKEYISYSYFSKTKELYLKWGAKGKFEQIENANKELEAKYETQSSAEKINMTEAKTEEPILKNSIIETVALVDTSSVMKAAQLLSQEIVYEKLVNRLKKVIMETSGAQKSVLIEVENSELRVAQGFEIYEGNEEMSFLKNIEKQVPISIIEYIVRTHDRVIIEDIKTDKNFINDEYIIKNKPKSILAIPLLSQGKISKILYLENSLSTGVFTGERVKFLQLLSGQVLISLENARIYKELGETIEERTMELENESVARQKLQKKYEELATHDSLTGLANKLLYMDRLEHALKNSRRHKFLASIIYIDLDGFKKINELYGRDAGDFALKVISKRLIECVRTSDTVARIGGDEFTIILEKFNDVENIDMVCKRITESIPEEIEFDDNKLSVSVNLGISVYPYDGETSDELIKKADEALYKAKEKGENIYLYSNDEFLLK
jgi:diguanylate cyclase (GGDEF)-like protein